ncbi:MAG: prolipoprotein diacylglyceryl transferase [Clostridiales bacterium]|nr:prolipoprotein diacylglyceryl transferase [Clostridiales bacterium]
MNPIAFHLLGRPIYWYGIIIAVGVLVGIYLAMRYAKKLGYDPDMIIDFCLIAIPLAIVGARLYYVVFSWNYYSKNLLDIIKIWEGGLALYGAVIGGVAGAYIFARKGKISFWDLCDIFAPSLILGQALGRWGNFFNQEAYGYAINNPSWQWFPAAVYIDANSQWHMATFFYESMWNFAVFFFLLYYKRKRKKSGEIFLLYLILYSVGRVVIEGLRTDSLYLGSFRVSQLLSGILIVAGTAFFIARRKKEDSLAIISDLEETVANAQAVEEESLDENSPADQHEVNSEEIDINKIDTEKDNKME